jgi:hypothetical protein
MGGWREPVEARCAFWIEKGRRKSLALGSDVKSNSDIFCTVVLRARKDGRMMKAGRGAIWTSWTTVMRRCNASQS